MTSDQALVKNCNELILNCKSLILATASRKTAHASYVPFITLEDKFYILVSELAEHTAYLKQPDHEIGCMIIEDESTCTQIFARRRFMFKSKPKNIARGSEQWPDLIALFNRRFGDIIELLDSLPDFSMFELKPKNRVLVKGFGDAHKISDAVLMNNNT